MSIDLIDFQELKRLVSCESVLRHSGWVPNHAGRAQLRGPCPIHRSTSRRSRSLAVSRWGFCCHSCGARGDVLTLVQQLRGGSVVDAAAWLARTFHFQIPRLAPTGHAGTGKRNGS